MDEILTWLFDINLAIEQIFDFLPNKKDFFEFEKDLKTKKAIERNIEIIGEATNRILKAKPDFEISNAKKIISTRNRIAHDYENVSETILWAIIINDLPLLQTEIKDLIEKHECIQQKLQ
jgi:uncharacterized protein with HEPN domain